MKHIITILLLSIILHSCGQSESKSKVIADNQEKAICNVEIFHYDSLTIPLFFEALTKNHFKDFFFIDSLKFNQFGSQSNINTTESSNIRKYFTIKILHEIFTSQTASDCSRGEIINIPYQWHWIEPNPRYEIRFTNNKNRLRDTEPPNEFSKYNSYADIDRTPYLFLSDLVNEESKYYSNSCDTFATFGWCSEREMAFIALVKLLDFEGKIVAEGNHSWSELIIPLKLNTGEFQNFKVKVDNTFNQVDWTTIASQDLTNWKGYFGNAELAGWYNQKASSNYELDRIKNHLVSDKFILRMENAIVEYLKNK